MAVNLYLGAVANIGVMRAGLIDNVMIFNRALTADDVALLYNLGNGTAQLSVLDPSRQINAIVEYLGPQPMDGLSGGSRPAFEVLVRNHPTEGITSKELDTGGDKIKLPMRIDLAGKTVRLTRIVAQDKAMLRLRAW